jgi:hypothetical protein
MRRCGRRVYGGQLEERFAERERQELDNGRAGRASRDHGVSDGNRVERAKYHPTI